MHKVLVNRLGGLGLPRKSVVRLTDRPDMTLDVYRGHTTIIQQQQQFTKGAICCNVLKYWDTLQPNYNVLKYWDTLQPNYNVLKYWDT